MIISGSAYLQSRQCCVRDRPRQICATKKIDWARDQLCREENRNNVDETDETDAFPQVRKGGKYWLYK